MALKATAPGVADFYQGSELWDLSLVDPDNRRPVDFDHRIALLDRLPFTDVSRLLANWQDGSIKLFVTQRLATFRRQRRDLFDGGVYIPLEVVGPRREHVVAFARRADDAWSLTIVSRLVATLSRTAGLDEAALPVGAAAWGNTRVLLPDDAPAHWRDVLTDERLVANDVLPLATVFHLLPLAILESVPQ